jgi:hypothetical protein
MKTQPVLCVSMLVALLLLAGGCAPGPRGDGPTVVHAGPLAAQMDVPAETVGPGQVVGVSVTTWNLGDEPVAIARTASNVYRVEVARHDGIGWVTFSTHPATEAIMLRRLTLNPHSQRGDTVNVRVDPDWPTGEVVRLRAVMNGRPELNMSDFLTVRP